MGPLTHAPPTVWHDVRGRAASRGRECGGDKRGEEPAAPQPANHRPLTPTATPGRPAPRGNDRGGEGPGEGLRDHPALDRGGG